MAEQMSKDELVGFHKGSLTTLLKERQELSRIVSIVDQLVSAHVKSLEKLGFKIENPKKDDMDEKLEDLLKSS